MNRSAVGWLKALLVCALVMNSARAEIEQSDIEVVASIKPLALIATEVLQFVPKANVSVIVDRNASPHQFSLKPSNLQSLMDASAILWLGPEFEPYLEKALSKIGRDESSILVSAIPKIVLLEARSVEENQTLQAHDHHGHHHHHAGSDDPHLWWNTDNAVLIAEALTERLNHQIPQHKPEVAKGLQKLKQRIGSVKSELKKVPDNVKGSFVVYHDSLSYLEHELGLASQRRVAVSPEAKPTVRDLLSLKMLIVRGKVNCIVLEPSASQKFIQKINPDNQASVVMIDPLGWDANSYSEFWQRGANALLDCL